MRTNFVVGLLLILSLALLQGQTTPQTLSGQIDQAGFWTVHLNGILMLAVVLLAPFLAVHIQWRLQLRRERRDRQFEIFKTLMATRATAMAPAHVQALNSIDIEFYGKGKMEKGIRESWHLYLDHLGTQRDPNAPQTWDERRADLQIDLIYQMAQYFNYEFDKVSIKRGVYYPKGLGDLENEGFLARQGMLELLAGTRSIKMEVVSFPIDEDFADSQKKFTKVFLDLIEKGVPFPVVVVGDRQPEQKQGHEVPPEQTPHQEA